MLPVKRRIKVVMKYLYDEKGAGLQPVSELEISTRINLFMVKFSPNNSENSCTGCQDLKASNLQIINQDLEV